MRHMFRAASRWCENTLDFIFVILIYEYPDRIMVLRQRARSRVSFSSTFLAFCNWNEIGALLEYQCGPYNIQVLGREWGGGSEREGGEELPCAAMLSHVFYVRGRGGGGPVNPVGNTHRSVGLLGEFLLPHLQTSFSFFELLLFKAEVTF